MFLIAGEFFDSTQMAHTDSTTDSLLWDLLRVKKKRSFPLINQITVEALKHPLNILLHCHSVSICTTVQTIGCGILCYHWRKEKKKKGLAYVKCKLHANVSLLHKVEHKTFCSSNLWGSNWKLAAVQHRIDVGGNEQDETAGKLEDEKVKSIVILRNINPCLGWVADFCRLPRVVLPKPKCPRVTVALTRFHLQVQPVFWRFRYSGQAPRHWLQVPADQAVRTPRPAHQPHPTEREHPRHRQEGPVRTRGPPTLLWFQIKLKMFYFSL